jgi:hypothetical protein
VSLDYLWWQNPRGLLEAKAFVSQPHRLFEAQQGYTPHKKTEQYIEEQDIERRITVKAILPAYIADPALGNNMTYIPCIRQFIGQKSSHTHVRSRSSRSSGCPAVAISRNRF